MKRILIGLFLLCLNAVFYAQENKQILYLDSTENWNLHFQYTNIWQMHPAFKAAYSGQHSLNSFREEALSLTATLFFGVRLWKGSAFYYNPEIAGGKGVSSAFGVAGFPNGETFRIGNPAPAFYTARCFLKQTIRLSGKDGGEIDDSPNALFEKLPARRIVITLGKFSVADVFDNNTYSHNPRNQFMNWSLMSNGAWDYPANTRGYTWGGAAELVLHPYWAFRLGTAAAPIVANGPALEYDFKKASSYIFEVERDYLISSRPGSVRILLFRNLNRAGNYRNTINQKNSGEDTSLNVNIRTTYGGMKNGLGINVEQEVADNIGIFARAGWNDGLYATWAFTEIDRSASAGVLMRGKLWKRNDDELGIAYVANGISKDHRDFLNAGGYGFIIGDGKLEHYGTEQIVETYYNFKVSSFLFLSGDYQFVINPAYNKDRGPVHLMAVRLHIEF